MVFPQKGNCDITFVRHMIISKHVETLILVQPVLKCNGSPQSLFNHLYTWNQHVASLSKFRSFCIIKQDLSPYRIAHLTVPCS